MQTYRPAFVIYLLSTKVEAALRACGAEKRALPIARQIQNDGSNKVFVPFVMSSAGGFGPGARKFLKFLYKSSR
jgi:hypothetical protein